MEKLKWYVYIIECLNGKYYTGMTCNIISRYKQHQKGAGSIYTKKYGVKKLSYYEEHNNLDDARYREKQIKKWRQEKKENLINGEWSILN